MLYNSINSLINISKAKLGFSVFSVFNKLMSLRKHIFMKMNCLISHISVTVNFHTITDITYKAYSVVMIVNKHMSLRKHIFMKMNCLISQYSELFNII